MSSSQQTQLEDIQIDSQQPYLLVGLLPPPHHGQSIANQILFSQLEKLNNIVIVPMRFSDDVQSVGKFSITKIIRLALLLVGSWAAVLRLLLKFRKLPILYYQPASPNKVPIIRDALFLPFIRPLTAKTIFHFHSGGLAEYLEAKKYTRLISHLAYNRPFTCIEIAKVGTPQATFFKPKLSFFVPNGIPDPSAEPTIDQSAAPNSNQAKTILYVGNYIATKGIFTILEVATLLKEKYPNAIFHLVGGWQDETTKETALSIHAQNHLESSVKFLGKKLGSEKWQEYTNADIFFFPSKYEAENFPLVLLEASAFGLPTIASDWRGIPEIIVEGQTGILHKPEDFSGFANSIAKLLNNPEKLAKFGANARQRYLQNYTEEHFVTGICQALHKTAKS